MNTNNIIIIVLVAIIAVTLIMIGIFFIGEDNSNDNPIISNNTTNLTVNNTTTSSVDSSSSQSSNQGSSSSSNSVSSSSENEAFDGDPDMIAQAQHYRDTHGHDGVGSIVARKYIGNNQEKIYYGDGHGEIVSTG
jgi:cytoskeletal protein RodZ